MGNNVRTPAVWVVVALVITVGLLSFIKAGTSSSEKRLARLVSEMEKNIKLPAGAHKFESYDRYYANDSVDGSQVIAGLFRYNPSERGKIFLVSNRSLPRVFDGGCNIIHLRYSKLQNRVESIECTGEA